MNALKLTTLTVLVLGVAASAVLADPLPGQKPKFSQVPMIATPIEGQVYYGHDELSTAWWHMDGGTADPLYQGVFMADDFADRVDGPVVHVTWWGSYLNQIADQPVNQFLICFETDMPANDPAGQHPFSYPDQQIINQVVTRGPLAPGSGTFTERLIAGSNPAEPVYMYNAELACPFPQLADEVFWIKIVALVDVPAGAQEMTEWGWHNRDYTVKNDLASGNVLPGEQPVGTLPDGTAIYHFQDDAVTGQVDNIAILEYPCQVHVDQDPDLFQETYYQFPDDGPDMIGDYSKDLAFELFTPEPATLALVGLGLAGLAARRQRG